MPPEQQIQFEAGVDEIATIVEPTRITKFLIKIKVAKNAGQARRFLVIFTVITFLLAGFIYMNFIRSTPPSQDQLLPHPGMPLLR